MDTAAVVAVANRYQQVRELGKGAMGQVFLATDTNTQRLVAVKRLHEMVAVQGGARLRREFRSLGRLKHPNIVQVFDYGEDNGSPYLVMEYVEGQDLGDWLATNPSWRDTVRAFARLADALSAVHAQGLIHRDLKPENIRMTPKGQPKLMDFGLAKPLEGSVALTRAGAVVGTVLYMAPEQCRGLELDYRADLYALGAVLFRSLANRPPFEGTSIAQVLMQHINQPVPNIRQFNPDIPEALEQLIFSLMAKLPSERPSSAVAVRDALLGVLEGPVTITSFGIEIARADALLVAPLVGRDAELRELMQVFESEKTGLVAVTGDTGTGKTRLLHALQEQVRSRDQRLAWGDAIEFDPQPFGVLSRLITNTVRYQRHVFTTLSVQTRNDLARIGPELHETGLAQKDTQQNLPPDVQKLRLFEAFAQLVEAITRKSLIVLENLHFCDAATIELLAHALRVNPEARVVVTYRLEDLPNGSDVPLGLPRPKNMIALGALGADAMSHLLRARLDGEIEPTLENEITAGADGNPGLLEERLKAMLESGAVSKRGGVYEWNRSVTKSPENLADLLLQRLSTLPPQPLEFAKAASVLGRQFMFGDARQLLEWQDDWALDALEQLVRGRFVSEVRGTGGEGFRFTHPLYPELLTESILALKRRRYHARAATLLAGRVPLLELARHHLEGGNIEAAVTNALDAGREAARALAYPLAERAYRLVLSAEDRLTNPNLKLEGLRARSLLAQVLSIGGRNEEALQLWQHVIDTAPQLQDGADVASQAKVALVKVNRYMGKLEQSLTMVGTPNPNDSHYDELCAELSAVHRSLKNWPEARRLGIEGLRSARKQQHLSNQVRAVAALAKLEQAQGNNHHAERLMRLAVRWAEQTGELHLLTWMLTDLAVTLKRQHKYEESLRISNEALSNNRQVGDIAHQLAIESNIALILYDQGEFLEATQHLESGMGRAERAGYAAFQQNMHVNLAWCEYALGKPTEARSRMRLIDQKSLLAYAKELETRIDLELGDERVAQMPTGDSSVELLTQAQFLVANGRYQEAALLTQQPNDEDWWAWAVVRLHALWKLGQDVRPELAALTSTDRGLKLAAELQASYSDFVVLVVGGRWRNSPLLRQMLHEQAKEFTSSAIGILAREALSILGQQPTVH